MIRSVIKAKCAVLFVLRDHLATEGAQVMLIAHTGMNVTPTRGNA